MPAVLLGVLSAPARGALLGDYPLQGNFDNAVPGLDALVPHSVGSGSSWSFTSEGWSFQNVAGVGQTGLSLEIPATLSTYSVGMVLQLSHVTAYSKLLDFSGLTSDTGLYVYNNALNLYVGGSSSGGNIESNTPFPGGNSQRLPHGGPGTRRLRSVDGDRAWRCGAAPHPQEHPQGLITRSS